jgi:Fe-S cluster biosynthesis and repair protein YggX
MTRLVQCVKLGREAEGLKTPPYPGELGKKIYLNVSQEAWKMWLKHQTMIINEYRLSPVDPRVRKMLEEEMEKFFFGEGSVKPPEYVPPGN